MAADITRTRTALENRPEITQLDIDGDTRTEEAVFRAMLETDDAESFEQFVEEELDVEIHRRRWVVFGEEVVLR